LHVSRVEPAAKVGTSPQLLDTASKFASGSVFDLKDEKLKKK